MQLLSPPPSPQRPPPLWFVTDGALTVGPVRTELLLRGVRHGRIPDDCLVRELHWRDYRPLFQIREVRALEQALARDGWVEDVRPFARPPASAAERLLGRASDPGEALHLAMLACVEDTAASFGLVHRFQHAWNPPITRCAYGILTQGLLGRPLPVSDLVLGAARARRLVLGAPSDGAVHRGLALRLASGLFGVAGVAMVPVVAGPELVAMIELGRTQHAFRQTDGPRLERTARLAAARMLDWA